MLNVCPNWQWRTVVALARFGGIRCSSEVALLKWSDIHWDSDRFTVTSPKTKRYGKPSRVVPLFSELRGPLDEAFAMAQEGEQWVIPMLGGQTVKNLSTTLKKIIRRAGVEVWPKPFQNMRASRQTELEQKFPTYVVCKWLGNTPHVALKHYLTVTDEDYQKAVQNWGLTGDKLGTQPPAEPRTGAHEKTRVAQNIGENASFSEVVDILENARVAGTGFEREPCAPVNSQIVSRGAAKSGALDAAHQNVEAELNEMTSIWPLLSADLRKAVLTIIRAGRDG